MVIGRRLLAVLEQTQSRAAIGRLAYHRFISDERRSRRRFVAQLERGFCVAYSSATVALWGSGGSGLSGWPPSPALCMPARAHVFAEDYRTFFVKDGAPDRLRHTFGIADDGRIDDADDDMVDEASSEDISDDGGYFRTLAEASSRLIVAGDTAGPWLDGWTVVAPAVRDYTVLSASEQAATGQWNIGKQAKIGDQDCMVTAIEESHEVHADPALIIAGNRILNAKKSGNEIERAAPGPSEPSMGEKLPSDVNDVAVSFSCWPRPDSVFTRQG